jgi:multidrug efflux pump subunit AcrA (membrane-fusion protein)
MTSPGPDAPSFRERALGGSGNPLEQLDRLFRLTSRRTWAAVGALGILVGAVAAWGFIAEREVTVTAPGLLVPRNGFIEVARLESGVVGEVLVQEGDRVQKGEVLATYVAPGNIPSEIVAPVDGKVEEVEITAGSTLVPGLPSFTMVPIGANTLAVAFASPAAYAQIDVGMEVTLQAASAPAAQYGSILGEIVRISNIPTTLARIDRLTGGNQELAQAFLAGGPVYAVEVRLERDPDTVTGYRWTTDDGADYPVPAGTIVQMTAVVGTSTIASELFK